MLRHTKVERFIRAAICPDHFMLIIEDSFNASGKCDLRLFYNRLKDYQLVKSDQRWLFTMKKKKTAVLIISIVLITGITFAGGLFMSVEQIWLRIAILALSNLLNGAVAVIAMKVTEMKPDFDLKNIKQYGIGIIIAILLSLTIAVIPALCGFSLVGPHKDFAWFSIIYNFLNYFLIIGPVEELIFRVYIQDTFVSFFDKGKYIGVVLSAFLFGLWHLINGSLIQVLFTFGIGLVFGTCKYLIKDCKYPGLAVGHGLYDFLNEIVRIFII